MVTGLKFIISEKAGKSSLRWEMGKMVGTRCKMSVINACKDRQQADAGKMGEIQLTRLI